MATDADQPHIFVMDQLNTHKSETLVKWIAEQEGIPTEKLGKKGVEGILELMDTRVAFLADPTSDSVSGQTLFVLCYDYCYLRRSGLSAY